MISKLNTKGRVSKFIERTYLFLIPILFFLISCPLVVLFRYLLVFFLIAAIFLILIKNENPFKINPKGFVISIYFIALCLSLLWTENWKEGLRIIERSLSLIIYPFVFVPIFKYNKKAFVNRLLISFAYGVIFFIFLGYIHEFAYELYYPKDKWIEYITKNEINYFFHNVVLRMDFHHSYLSLYCLIGAICLLFLKTRKRKKLHCLGGFFLLLQPLLFMSRTGTLISFFILFVWCYVNKKKLFSVIILLFIIIISLFNKEKIFSRFDNIAEVFEDSNRMSMWASSLNLIKNNYILGIGVGDVQNSLIQQYKEKNFTKGVEEKYNAHNQYLQSYLSAGIFGIVSLGAAFLLALIIARTVTREQSLVFYGILLVIMISIFTESMLQRERGIFLYSMVLSIILLSNNNLKEAKE